MIIQEAMVIRNHFFDILYKDLTIEEMEAINCIVRKIALNIKEALETDK